MNPTNTKPNQISESLFLSMLLTLSGGLMDAYSFMCRGEVFANAQTGNILLFAINVSKGNYDDILKYLIPVIAFAAGIFVSEVLRHTFLNKKGLHWRQYVALTEAAILIGVAFIPQSLNLLANSLISFACGAQVQSFRKLKGCGVATTMCIGNLRSAVNSFSDYLYSKNKISAKNGFLYLSLILFFAAGAVIGNFLVELYAEYAIILSGALLFVGFIVMFIDTEKSKT